METRKDKVNFYLDLAATIARQGTCLRRVYGAVIVKDDEVISTGYNGAPRGCPHCKECTREKLKVAHGERYELCMSVHAEQNAIIHAARRDMLGSTLYLVGYDVVTGELLTDTAPCCICEKMIINAGIKKIIARISPTEYKETSTELLSVRLNFEDSLKEENKIETISDKSIGLLCN